MCMVLEFVLNVLFYVCSTQSPYFAQPVDILSYHDHGSLPLLSISELVCLVPSGAMM